MNQIHTNFEYQDLTLNSTEDKKGGWSDQSMTELDSCQKIEVCYDKIIVVDEGNLQESFLQPTPREDKNPSFLKFV